MSIGQPGEFAPVLAKRVSSVQVLSTLITFLDTRLIFFEIQDCNLRYCNGVMLFATSDFSPCTYIDLSNISPAKETNLTNVQGGPPRFGTPDLGPPVAKAWKAEFQGTPTTRETGPTHIPSKHPNTNTKSQPRTCKRVTWQPASPAWQHIAASQKGFCQRHPRTTPVSPDAAVTPRLFPRATE